VTSLWYIRDVDPSTLLLTGLTRDGVFLIERGEVVGAVNNFRFNESPVGVLQRTVEVGRTELALSREIGDEMFIEAPPIRVDGFFMSSVSDSV
jgi:predicted Zn-dependent protease